MPDFKAFRNDRNGSGGGLIAYIRTNLPARRRTDLEFDIPIESIVLDVIINNRKWAVLGTYRPPSVKNSVFTDIFTKGLDRISTHYDNILIAGNLNYDMLDKPKGATLSDICDIFDLSSLIKSATCHMKNSKSSLVDVLLTNKHQYCCNALNFGCGVSDWHNLVGVMIKGTSARVEKRRVQYRSFKSFDEKQFCSDVGQIPFDAAYVFDDVDDIYWAHE